MQLHFSYTDPALSAFAVTSIILILNLLTLWILSGARRVHSRVAINSEDGALYNIPVSETDPPEVARYLRAHRNAEATIYPFLFLGLIYVVAGGYAYIAIPIFGLFVLARLGHSFAYLQGLQPWRTLTFAASVVAIAALIFATIFLWISR